MPTAAISISWLGALGWLAAIAAASFLVAWVLTSRLGVRRAPYIAALALLTGGLAWGYLAWSDTSLASFATSRWVWGLVGAAVTGAILVRLSRHQPPGPRSQGWRLAATLAWEGVLYGSTEGLLLSVLPVLVAWQAFAAHGWTSGPGRSLVAGTAAMGASLAVIVVHHLGYRGFHTPAALVPVLVGCGLLSLAYLLTASPLAAVGGHILLHTALSLRGTEMPPYATGGAPHRPPRPATASSQDRHAGPLRKPDQPSERSGHQDYPGLRPAKLHGDKGYDYPRCRRALRRRGITRGSPGVALSPASGWAVTGMWWSGRWRGWSATGGCRCATNGTPTSCWVDASGLR